MIVRPVQPQYQDILTLREARIGIRCVCRGYLGRYLGSWNRREQLARGPPTSRTQRASLQVPGWIRSNSVQQQWFGKAVRSTLSSLFFLSSCPRGSPISWALAGCPVKAGWHIRVPCTRSDVHYSQSGQYEIQTLTGARDLVQAKPA
jgi:hypothetical protein